MPIQQKDPTPKPPQKKIACALNRCCGSRSSNLEAWREMGGLQERLLRFVILRYGPQVRMEKPMGKNHGKKKHGIIADLQKKMAEKNDPHNQILSL